MAEETVNYTLEFDEADIAAKLQNLRDQVNQALGSASLESDAGMPSAGYFTGGLPAQAAQMAPDQYSNFSQDLDQSFWQNIGTTFDSMSQNAQLGYQKFVGDARRMSLLTDQAPPQPQQMPLLPEDPFGPQSFGSSLFKLGHMPDGPMSRGEYVRRSNREVGDGVGEFVTATGEGLNAFDAMSMLSMPLAMVGGAGATAAANTIGVPFTMAALGIQGTKFFGRRESERNEIAEGLEMMAQRSGLRHYSMEDGLKAAETMSDATYSLEGEIQGRDIELMQAQIMQFGDAGGFKGAGSADEFNNRIEGLVKNVREFAYNLDLAQTEAASLMGQLESKLITTSEKAAQFSASMANQGDNLGMRGGDLIGLGLQGSQMVQGSFISEAEGFDMVVKSRQQVGNMYSQPGGSRIINAMGGANQTALANTELLMRFGNSGAGMLFNAAAMGGFEGMGTGSFGDMFGAAGDTVSDPRKLYKLMHYNQEITEAQGVEGLQTNLVGTAINLADKMGAANPDGTVNMSAVATQLAGFGNYSPQEAESLIRQTIAGANMTTDDRYTDMVASMQGYQDANEIGMFSWVGGGINRAWTAITTADAAEGGVRNLNRASRSISEGWSDFWNDQITVKGVELNSETGKLSQRYLKEAMYELKALPSYSSKVSLSNADKRNLQKSGVSDEDLDYLTFKFDSVGDIENYIEQNKDTKKSFAINSEDQDQVDLFEKYTEHFTALELSEPEKESLINLGVSEKELKFLTFKFKDGNSKDIENYIEQNKDEQKVFNLTPEDAKDRNVYQDAKEEARNEQNPIKMSAEDQERLKDEGLLDSVVDQMARKYSTFEEALPDYEEIYQETYEGRKKTASYDTKRSIKDAQISATYLTTDTKSQESIRNMYDEIERKGEGTEDALLELGKQGNKGLASERLDSVANILYGVDTFTDLDSAQRKTTLTAGDVFLNMAYDETDIRAGAGSDFDPWESQSGRNIMEATVAGEALDGVDYMIQGLEAKEQGARETLLASQQIVQKDLGVSRELSTFLTEETSKYGTYEEYLDSLNDQLSSGDDVTLATFTNETKGVLGGKTEHEINMSPSERSNLLNKVNKAKSDPNSLEARSLRKNYEARQELDARTAVTDQIELVNEALDKSGLASVVDGESEKFKRQFMGGLTQVFAQAGLGGEDVSIKDFTELMAADSAAGKNMRVLVEDLKKQIKQDGSFDMQKAQKNMNRVVFDSPAMLAENLPQMNDDTVTRTAMEKLALAFNDEGKLKVTDQ